MQELVQSQSLRPDHNVASLIEDGPPQGGLSARGYSDSMVPTYLALQKNIQQGHCGIERPVQNDVVAPLCAETISPQQSTLRVKTRQNLQLPSFKTLGILSRVPHALLTPPDETTVDFRPLPPLIPRSSSFPPTAMLKTPSPEPSDFMLYGTATSLAENSSSTQPTNPATESHREVNAEATESLEPSGSENEDGPDQGDWLAGVTHAAVANIDLQIMGSVISLLCHSQPCPLSAEIDKEITTAFTAMMSAVQNKIESTGRYIDVVHAVPARFNMAHIPSSPAMTPNVLYSGATPTDYFSITNVFSKAVVAIDHGDAMNASVPSSPHPVVPPSSIVVSLLERFIPPSTPNEYLHLFATDAPSVLVNRLVELSSSGGTLIFIYPTAQGAKTFADNYLGSLIHPLLRTMCSIHNLSMDFAKAIGTTGVVDQMLAFDGMTRKISILLRKLSRGTSTITRTAPKYTLVEASKQYVDLDRKVWTDWWALQETPRIRTVVDRYLQRGVKVPTGKDVTARSLVQEVLDGVRTRSYADYDAEREKVEVGVFVIKRTA